MRRLFSLRSRLFFLVLLAILPALAIIVYDAVESREAAEREARGDTLALVRLVAHWPDDDIRLAQQLLVALAQPVLALGDDAGRCKVLLSNSLVQQPRFNNLSVVRPDGTVLCSALPSLQTLTDVDRPYFLRAIDTKELQIGAYRFDYSARAPLLPFAEPVSDSNGELQAVILLMMDAAWFNEAANDMSLPTGSDLLMLDSHGTILDRFPEGTLWGGRSLPNAPVVQAVLSARGQGTAYAWGLDNVLRLDAFAPLGTLADTGSYIVAGVPAEIIFAQQDQLLRRDLALLGLGTLGALAAAWVFGEAFIIRRVAPVLQAARRLTEGDLSARTSLRYGYGELSQLARVFDSMAASLQHREAELADAEMKYRTLVEQIPAITYIGGIDEFSRARYVSPQVQSILGFTPDEWLASPQAWIDRLHSEDREHVLSELERIRMAAEPFQLEYRLLTKAGEWRWFHDQGAPIRDERGEVLFIQGILLDITDRKHIEDQLRTLNAEMEQRVRDRTAELEAANRELEAFSYTVSHDLRAPLAGIERFVGLLVLEHGTQLDAEGRQYLQLVEANVAEMNQMIQALLGFSRTTRQALRKEMVLPATLVHEVLETLSEERAGRQVQVTVDDLPACQADPRLLKLVYMNLISNALKFTRRRELAVVHVGYGKEQGQVVYFVRDNGVGFDMENAERLFGVFQRFHHAEDYEGTGVGLAIVDRVIRRHGGRVWAESLPDQGATFYFTLAE